MTITELLEARTAKAAEAHALLDRAEKEKRAITTEETRAFDAVLDDLDALNNRIERQDPGGRIDVPRNGDRKERLAAVERALNASRGRVTEPSRPAGGGSETATSEWRDSEGREVRVLAPGDAWAKGGRSDVTFGAVMRAMVTGPRNDAERRALSEGTDAAGGYTVPDILLGQFIDKMRAATTVIQAGARTVDLTSDVTKIARTSGDPVAAWRAEAGTVAESDPTFEALTFTARSLALMCRVSRELLEDSVNVEEALTAAIAGAMATEMDRVALRGSGTPPEPRGILNTSGIGAVTMGTNGAALTNYDKLLDTIYELLVDNAPSPTAAIMHPRTDVAFGKLKDTTNQSMRRPPMIEALPFLSTTGVSITEAEGTSGAIASRVYVGYYPHLYIGLRSGLRVDLLRELFAGNHQYAFLAHLRADIQLAHVESFSTLRGIIP